jgi:hypothetical protein
MRAFCIFILFTGCPRTQLANRCQADSECGNPASAFRCDSSGVCYCRTNDACPAAQFCNLAGYCQDRAGCDKSADCLDPSLFCDTGTGTCLSRGRCTTDVQCQLGEVCDGRRGVCATGCKSNGDCPGSACRCGDVACGCTGATPEERARCQLGVCDSSFCADDSFCRFGEVCGIPPDSGVTRAQCYSDFDIDVRPYCSRCASGGGIDTCGSGANYCIIDTRTNATYCGADCSEGQSCPRGYGCRDIRIVLTRWRCNASTPCPSDNTLPCSTDSECRRGGKCLKNPGETSGFCAGQCILREGSTFGYCSCQVDLDCPQQTCSQGECSINRKRCVNDGDCRTIRCVDFEGIGACLIGQNCTPSNGLTCVEVGASP